MDLASMCLVQNEVHLVYGSNLPSEIKELMKWYSLLFTWNYACDLVHSFL